MGRETWNYLVTEYRIIQNLQAPPRCVSPFPSITYVIRLGDESPVVTILQVLLDEIGKQYPNLPRVPITNVYDEPTMQAVKAFQQASRREITGEVAKGDWTIWPMCIMPVYPRELLSGQGERTGSGSSGHVCLFYLYYL